MKANKTDNLFLIANYYYNLGFNVTHILPIRNQNNNKHKTLLKAPSHKWFHYLNNRQSLVEFNSFGWKDAVGLGVILGYKNIRALDIDGCTDVNLVKQIISILGLPENYEWVVKSGSGKGFHIIFFCENHNFKTELDKIKAFKPNRNYLKRFKHIELRWLGHLVLPPSLHASNNKYKFLNDYFPYSKPSPIDIDKIYQLVNLICNHHQGDFLTIMDETNRGEVKPIQIYTRNDISKSGTYIEIKNDSPGNNEYSETSESKTYSESEESEEDEYLDASENGTYSEMKDEELDNDEYSETSKSGTYIEIEVDDLENKGNPTISKSGTFIDLEEPNHANLTISEIVEKYSRPFYLFFDTETTGKPLNWNLSPSNTENWPRIVQLSYTLCDKNGERIMESNQLIKPMGFFIPIDAAKVHGISTHKAQEEGKDIKDVLETFHEFVQIAEYLVAHNISFDANVLEAEFIRNNIYNNISHKRKICTMEQTVDFCALPSSLGYKWPKLSELHYRLFGRHFEGQHNATVDVSITEKCFWELRRLKLI